MTIHIFVVDGPDGVGKSTLINQLANYFNSSTSYDAVVISPSNTPYGKEVKRIIATHPDISLDVETRLQISTLQHAKDILLDIVKPYAASNKNIIVFLDRWDTSTGIYQFYIKGGYPTPFYTGERISLPHLTKYFILDAPDALLDDRLYSRSNNQACDPYERYDFQRKVRDGYRALFQRPVSLFTKVTVDGTVEENTKKLISHVIHNLR